MNKNAFTLIEIILSIALLAIISSSSLFFLNNFQLNNLEVSAESLKSELRRASILAKSSSNNSAWGVYINNNNFVLFSGDSYNSRNINFDQNFNFENNVISSSPEEVVFSKGFGESNFIGDIVLVSNERSLSLNINSLGVLD